MTPADNLLDATVLATIAPAITGAINSLYTIVDKDTYSIPHFYGFRTASLA